MQPIPHVGVAHSWCRKRNRTESQKQYRWQNWSKPLEYVHAQCMLHDSGFSLQVNVTFCC